MSQPSKLRVGFIGVGGIANARHLPWYADLPTVEIAALCDLSEDALDQTADKYGIPEGNCYVNYHDMLARDDLDAIEVCTPNHLHAAPTIAALQAGKHVLGQKPMASNVLYSAARDDVSDEARTYFESLGGRWDEEVVLDQEALPSLSPHTNYIEHWVDCLINDTEPVTDGREGLASLEIITASYASSASRAFIDLVHQ